MELGLKAKSVLVLASSAGLGKAPALEFAREGAITLYYRAEYPCGQRHDANILNYFFFNLLPDTVLFHLTG